MNAFTYEEQNSRKYLVYKMQEEESLDRLTLEMMSNNRIEGVALSNYMQIDDNFYMKYDITGLVSLREYLQGVVTRKKLLGILESIADAIMVAEEYMLSLSSYVLDEEYIYVDTVTKNVSMVVLPVMRGEAAFETFLKELLTDMQYDQSEDCSYVISLINLFGGSHTFSADSFKKHILQLKKSGVSSNFSKVKTQAKSGEQQFFSPVSEGEGSQSSQLFPDRENGQAFHVLSDREDGQALKSLSGREDGQALKALSDRENRNWPVSVKEQEEEAYELERKQALDVLFSNEDEEAPEKEKKGLFFRKKKSEENVKNEKTKKKSFWEKLSGNKKDKPDAASNMEPMMGGIAIPGLDMQAPMNINSEGRANGLLQGGLGGENVAIPVQNVEINKKAVEPYDFGETVFIGEAEDEDETFIIGQEQKALQPEFVLYRCSTGESFRISEKVTRIGRSETIADICISGNRGVGRVHALLYIQNGQVFIADNHSKNKTYVDGELLEPEAVPCRLEHGSKIRLGDEELEFYINSR